MQLQFQKTSLGCLLPAKREVQTQEQTQELRLNDAMPDIGRVLGAWGQVILRGKEWRSGGMGVSCGVMVWVLYEPEEGGEPKAVETWIPFQLKWDLPDTERDGNIWAQVLLKSVDARSVSARKMMIRACVSALGEAMVPGQAALYEPVEVPEDVHMLTRSYPVCLPREAGERPFAMEETLTVPASGHQVQKLICYSLLPQIMDKKVMSDKVVFRGSAVLHVVYVDQDGQLHSCDIDLPFSQYSELEREYDTDATATVMGAVTGLELDMEPEGTLRLKAGLTGQYVIYDRPVVRVVEDAYSPRRQVEPKIEPLQMPVVLDANRQSIRAEQTVPVEGLRTADLAFYPDQPRVFREDDGVQIQLPGQFQMLWYDRDGKLQSTVQQWEQSVRMDASEDSRVDALVHHSGKPQGAVGAEATMCADMELETQTGTRQGISMVTALELGEMTQPDPERPSLILRRAGDKPLWDIAKGCGSTVEAIRSANGLTDEPAPEDLLLIPIP